ncbi:hypothetical protein GOBAR_DD03895 [Gossypium barbadense]|nr:hypothetical protein GOBAR_DD03895 [Gossypium barbadense]
MPYFEAAGFESLIGIRMYALSANLISALVESWREVTITMEYVTKQLGLPVHEYAVTDFLYKLVKKCGEMLDHTFPKKEKPASTKADNKDAGGDCDGDGCDPLTSTTFNRKD